MNIILPIVVWFAALSSLFLMIGLVALSISGRANDFIKLMVSISFVLAIIGATTFFLSFLGGLI